MDYHPRERSVLNTVKTNVQPKRNFLSTFGMPILNILLLGLTLYVAIFRILNWNFIVIYLNARI